VAIDLEYYKNVVDSLSTIVYPNRILIQNCIHFFIKTIYFLNYV